MSLSETTSLSELSLRDAATHLRNGDVSAESYMRAPLDVCVAQAPRNAFISLDRGRARSARSTTRSIAANRERARAKASAGEVVR
jgi:hypothetical protein